MCGSSTATAATFAKVALPEMFKRGYSPAFSTGTIAAGGTLKSLIPPSIVMVLYCIATKTFIFDLFTAAVDTGVAGDRAEPGGDRGSRAAEPRSRSGLPSASAWAERWAALTKASPVLFLIAGVFGGLVQRHVHRERGGIGRGGLVLPVRARCAGRVTWASFFDGPARGRQRHRRCCTSS